LACFDTKEQHDGEENQGRSVYEKSLYQDNITCSLSVGRVERCTEGARKKDRINGGRERGGEKNVKGD